MCGLSGIDAWDVCVGGGGRGDSGGIGAPIGGGGGAKNKNVADHFLFKKEEVYPSFILQYVHEINVILIILRFCICLLVSI